MKRWKKMEMKGEREGESKGRKEEERGVGKRGERQR